MKCRDEFRRKQIPTFPCDNCSTLITKQKKGEHLFCDLKCRDEFRRRKYIILHSTFEDHKDEAAYLLGLIMGDGHFKRSGDETTRISIAFNVTDFRAINIAESVFQKLQIQHFVEAKTPHNCKTMGFVLPNDLLSRFGLLFHGNKFDNQPSCPKEAVHNLHFAVGLLNSDGCFYKHPDGRHTTISFVNTVGSIITDIKECLKYNDIEFKEYKYIHKKPSWKPMITISVAKKTSKEKILANEYCKWS